MSSTLEKITAKQNAINKKQDELSTLKTARPSLDSSLSGLHASKTACKRKPFHKQNKCMKGFDPQINAAILKVQTNAASQATKVKELSDLNAQMATLKKQLEVEQKNSATVTETLAQQGKTVESIEIVADAESKANAEAVLIATRIKSENEAVAARSAAAQELVQDEESNKMTQIIIAVVVVVALYFVYTKFIKK